MFKTEDAHFGGDYFFEKQQLSEWRFIQTSRRGVYPRRTTYSAQ